MNIAHSLERGCRRFPNKSALIFEGRIFTYRELNHLADSVAATLDHLGFARGDRIALALPNCPGFVIAYFGILKLGGVVVAINAVLEADELDFILQDSGARAIVATEEVNARLAPEITTLEYRFITAGDNLEGTALTDPAIPADPARAAADLRIDEPAAILYTSGTTGTSKGAMLTHGNVVLNGQSCAKAFPLRPDDRVMLCLPIFHSYGQNSILNPAIAVGATLVLLRAPDIDAVCRSLGDDQVTVFFGVPPLFSLLLNQLRVDQARGLRLCISAAVTLSADIGRAWQAAFALPIHDGHGMTETLHNTFNPEPRLKPGSVGLPLEGIELAVLDEAGWPVAEPDRHGEVAVRGANVSLGYWKRPEATAEALRDGWFRTGDIGRIDRDGYLYIVDRVKDMVNVGGTKVYPSEVEAVLARHPAVAEAAVYGVADALLGERVAAAVVFRAGRAVPAAELLGFCTRRLAGFKVPGRIEAIESLPKSPTGKILKRLLAERHQSERAPDPGSAAGFGACSAADIETWLRRWIAARLDMDAAVVATDRTFTEYGMTSLMAVSLAGELGAWLGRDLPSTLVWRFPTIASVGRYLALGQGEPESSSAAAPIVAVPRGDPLPLSFIQEEVWRRDRNPAWRGVLYLLVRLRCEGRLDEPALRESFDALVDRHEILRTRYAEIDGAPRQVIMPTTQIPWAAVDLRSLPEAAQTAEAERLSDAEARRAFDLARGPALRVSLLRLADTRYLLLIAIHHIGVDAWSVNLLLNELGTLYAARVTGRPAELPPQAIQYADFAHWQRRIFTPEVLAAQSAYWRDLLSTPPPEMLLPTDRPRPPEHGEQIHPTGAEELLLLPADLVSRLKDLGRRHDATIYTVLLAAYAEVLRRHSGCEDILIGAPSSKRTRPELDTLIGHFTGRSWLRIDLSGQPAFADLLARTRQVVLAALDNQYLTLRQWLHAAAGQIDWRPERPLAARANLNLLPPIAAIIELPGVKMSVLLPAQRTVIHSDISLDLWEEWSGDGLEIRGRCLYRRDLFEPARIVALIADFVGRLEAVTTDPARPSTSLGDDLMDRIQSPEAPLCREAGYEV